MTKLNYIFIIIDSISLTSTMPIQTRSQTKKQEEEEETRVSLVKCQNGWNLIHDEYSNYYVISDNYYTEGGDNYHEFNAKDEGASKAYYNAVRCFYDKVN